MLDFFHSYITTIALFLRDFVWLPMTQISLYTNIPSLSIYREARERDIIKTQRNFTFHLVYKKSQPNPVYKEAKKEMYNIQSLKSTRDRKEVKNEMLLLFYILKLTWLTYINTWKKWKNLCLVVYCFLEFFSCLEHTTITISWKKSK